MLGMKAVFMAFLFLIGVDTVANRSHGRHQFVAALRGMGHTIGSWVYYS